MRTVIKYYRSKLLRSGDGLEVFDGDELGDFEIAHTSYESQGDSGGE